MKRETKNKTDMLVFLTSVAIENSHAPKRFVKTQSN